MFAQTQHPPPKPRPPKAPPGQFVTRPPRRPLLDAFGLVLAGIVLAVAGEYAPKLKPTGPDKAADLRALHQAHRWLGLAADVFLAAGLVYGIFAVRAGRRRAVTAKVAEVVATKLGPVTPARRVPLFGVPDRRVDMAYRYGADDSPRAMSELKALLERRMGGPISVSYDQTTCIVIVRRQAREAPVLPEHERAQAVATAAGLTGALVSARRAGGFRLTHTAIRDADKAFRADLDRTMTAKLGHKLTSKWDTKNDHVDYWPAPELRRVVEHPVEVLLGADQLPFGTDGHGDPVAWDLDSKTPHCIVSASTGGGKTETILGLVIEATRRGHEVWVADSKKIGLMGLRGWPGVTRFEVEIPAISALILAFRNEIERRTALIFAAGTRAAEVAEGLTRLILVVDECWSTLDGLDAAWNAEPKQRGLSPATRQFSDAVRLAREPRMHVVVAFQRPDAKRLPGETRANFSCRIQIGPADRDALDMLRMTSAVDDGAPVGRAMVNVGAGQVEAQIYHTPNSAKRLSHPEADLLAALRPTHPVITATPDPGGFAPAPVEGEEADDEGDDDEPEVLAEVVHLHLVVPGIDPAKRCVRCHKGPDEVSFGPDASRPDGLNVRCVEDARVQRREAKAAAKARRASPDTKKAT